MSSQLNITVFSGSTRSASINKVLAKRAAAIVEEQGAVANYIDLRDYSMPLYDGDLEIDAGYPKAAAALKAILQASDGYIIASPEYNGSLSAVLKNTIDWLTRNEDAGTDISAFKNKTALLLSAAPGNLGGLRGLSHLRTILTNLGSIVVPEQLAIPKSFQAFGEDGSLLEPAQASMLQNFSKNFIELTSRIQ